MQPASATAVYDNFGNGPAAVSASSGNGVPGSPNGMCSGVTVTGLPVTGPCSLLGGGGSSTTQYTVGPAQPAPSPPVPPWMDVLQTVFIGPSADAETNLFGGFGCPISGCQPQPTPTATPKVQPQPAVGNYSPPSRPQPQKTDNPKCTEPNFDKSFLNSWVNHCKYPVVVHWIDSQSCTGNGCMTEPIPANSSHGATIGPNPLWCDCTGGPACTCDPQ
jgi:hypothetical protein